MHNRQPQFENTFYDNLAIISSLMFAVGVSILVLAQFIGLKKLDKILFYVPNAYNKYKQQQQLRKKIKNDQLKLSSIQEEEEPVPQISKKKKNTNKNSTEKQNNYFLTNDYYNKTNNKPLKNKKRPQQTSSVETISEESEKIENQSPPSQPKLEEKEGYHPVVKDGIVTGYVTIPDKIRKKISDREETMLIQQCNNTYSNHGGFKVPSEKEAKGYDLKVKVPFKGNRFFAKKTEETFNNRPVYAICFPKKKH